MIDMSKDVRQQLKEALRAFTEKDLRTASIDLLNTLGYRSEKTLDISNSPDAFLEEFDKRDRRFRREKALFSNWETIDFLFQITDDEVIEAAEQGSFAFSSGFDVRNYRSYLFFALDLKEGNYTRTDISSITREINLLFDMPVMLLIRNKGLLTFSVIDRRLHKRDESRDVLEKVKLLKDIRCCNPHRAHVEILNELSLQNIISEFRCTNFLELHEAWRKVLNIEELNRQFYKRIQEWFFWAAKNVRFPHGGIDNEDLRNRTALIRLLTRIVFCWFAREKELIPDRLFSPSTPHHFLKQFDAQSETDGCYYKAILQNLFFPTLSVPLDKREFRNGRRFKGVNEHYMRHDLFRHEKLFKNADDLGKLFADIPFLNGGLFECLDSGTCSADEVRVDGFSDVKLKQPLVPNVLFFGNEIETDLSDAYGLKSKSAVKVDGLFNILRDYKFTVAENTPIEEEVALDPELLGRIFENLLAEYNEETKKTARKETGSFYTPRTIVEYMVDLTLKAYLRNILMKKQDFSEENAESALEILFSYTEKEHPFSTEEKLTMVEAIHNITILDPACGSGAFPMGMLQKLVYILEKLDLGHELWKQKILEETPAAIREETRKLLARSTTDHNWKLGLIQHCIYGVDIQPVAVQIAKLRCFISLLVDFKVYKQAENMGVPALPNLDFKFVAADTLICPPGTNQENDLIGDPFFGKLAHEAEGYFFIRDPDEKRKLRCSIETLIDEKIKEKEKSLEADQLREDLTDAELEELSKRKQTQIKQAEFEIKLWESYRNIFASRNKPVCFFDTRYFFPEINEGFDIVIGNPPYIQIQKFTNAKKNEWKAQDYETYTATGDIYCLFYERGVQLLKPNGHLCYIASNKWMRAKYGEKLRDFFSTAVNVNTVLDFGMGLNFGAAAALTCIVQISRGLSLHKTRCCYASDSVAAMADPAEYFDNNEVTMSDLSSDSWVVLSPARHEIKQLVQKQGIPLKEWDLSINYGIKTGLNDAFYITDEERAVILEKEPQADEIIVPLLRGRFVKRYGHSWDGTWMINSHNGVKGKQIQPVNLPEEYPVLFKHLSNFENALKKRQDKGDQWYNLRNCAYLDAFSKPKIIYPEITKWMPFYFDANESIITNQKCFIMTSNSTLLPYLTAVFNSSLFRCCFKDNFPDLLGNSYELRKVFFEKIPIKKPDKSTAKFFKHLVYYIQFVKAHGKAVSGEKVLSAIIPIFLEELIDACVMEVYFPEHMAEKNLCVINEIRKGILSFDKRDDDELKWEKVKFFYQYANSSEHPIRERLKRISFESPELLRVIKEEGKV